MRVLDEPLRNARNDATVSVNIKQYFCKYPNSTASQCCRSLAIDYEKYGLRARKIKHDLIQWRKSIVCVTPNHGRPLGALPVHRLEYTFMDPVPPSFILALEEKASASKVEGAWYRSPNRNRQLQYSDKSISVRVYPKSGTCRILAREPLSFDDLRVHVEDVFENALPPHVYFDVSFEKMIKGLQVVRRHRTFPVGPLTPFKIDFYRDPLGLYILADASHPECLEVHENWPTWIPPLLEFQRIQTHAIDSNTKAVSEFALQIRSHLDAIRAIGLAADRLNEVIRSLTLAINRGLNSADGSSASSTRT
jgi:hypothetical protein